MTGQGHRQHQPEALVPAAALKLPVPVVLRLGGVQVNLKFGERKFRLYGPWSSAYLLLAK